MAHPLYLTHILKCQNKATSKALCLTLCNYCTRQSQHLNPAHRFEGENNLLSSFDILTRDRGYLLDIVCHLMSTKSSEEREYPGRQEGGSMMRVSGSCSTFRKCWVRLDALTRHRSRDQCAAAQKDLRGPTERALRESRRKALPRETLKWDGFIFSTGRGNGQPLNSYSMIMWCYLRSCFAQGANTTRKTQL